jgi:protein-L-isoaspartate(D-aspartate) O-methyltransferase
MKACTPIWLRAAGFALLMLWTAWAPAQTSDDEFASDRKRMMREIRQDVAQTSSYIGKYRLNKAAMEAMATVPRHEFVPPSIRSRAYDNRPLPIGHGQTISQPYIVALMTDLVDPQADDTVLEIGTGSGYQAAILARLVDKVYSIEIIEALGLSAGARLSRLGFDNVETRIGDGYHGWPEHGPFDAIVVTAAASHIPPPLVKQLKPGGTMLIPVGSQFQVQQLTLVRKDDDGEVKTRQVLPVRFVPLTGGH